MKFVRFRVVEHLDWSMPAFEPQIWRLWWPFWCSLPENVCLSTFDRLADAWYCIDRFRNPKPRKVRIHHGPTN